MGGRGRWGCSIIAVGMNFREDFSRLHHQVTGIYTLENVSSIYKILLGICNSIFDLGQRLIMHTLHANAHHHTYTHNVHLKQSRLPPAPSSPPPSMPHKQDYPGNYRKNSPRNHTPYRSEDPGVPRPEKGYRSP